MITSHERVNNAIERKPNDRSPYNFRGEPEVYENIKIQPADLAAIVFLDGRTRSSQMELKRIFGK